MSEAHKTIKIKTKKSNKLTIIHKKVFAEGSY